MSCTEKVIHNQKQSGFFLAHPTSQLSMKVIIQLQYSLTDSRVFHDVKNITQSSLHPTQPNPQKKLKKTLTQPNPTHG